MQVEPLRFMPRPEVLDRIGGYGRRSRDLGQRSAVRPPEPQRAVGLAIDLVAF